MISLRSNVPPSGRWVNLPVCEVYLIRKGKIVGGRGYFDIATLMRQLGRPPDPASVSGTGSVGSGSRHQGVHGGAEVVWRVAAQIQSKYRAVAQAGIRAGPDSGQLNAVRAEVYREILAVLLGEAQNRPLTRQEMAAWLAGRPISAHLGPRQPVSGGADEYAEKPDPDRGG